MAGTTSAQSHMWCHIESLKEQFGIQNGDAFEIVSDNARIPLSPPPPPRLVTSTKKQLRQRPAWKAGDNAQQSPSVVPMRKDSRWENTVKREESSAPTFCTTAWLDLQMPFSPPLLRKRFEPSVSSCSDSFMTPPTRTNDDIEQRDDDGFEVILPDDTEGAVHEEGDDCGKNIKIVPTELGVEFPKAERISPTVGRPFQFQWSPDEVDYSSEEQANIFCNMGDIFMELVPAR